jgi:hypothetical protein
MALIGALERYESGGGIRSKTAAMTARMARAGSVVAGAALTSFATVKWGDPQKGLQIGGVAPLTLTVAALGYTAAYFKLGGDYDGLLAGFADGALAAYAAGVGRLAGAGQLSVMGLGAKPLTQEAYGKLLAMNDPHRRGR